MLDGVVCELDGVVCFHTCPKHVTARLFFILLLNIFVKVFSYLFFSQYTTNLSFFILIRLNMLLSYLLELSDLCFCVLKSSPVSVSASAAGSQSLH